MHFRRQFLVKVPVSDASAADLGDQHENSLPLDAAWTAAEQFVRADAISSTVKSVAEIACARDAEEEEASEDASGTPTEGSPAQQVEARSRLPPGWTCHFDIGTNRQYFHHAEHGVSTWIAPVRAVRLRR